MAKNNPRYECKGCKGKPTRNQLKNSNGICIYCKTPMHHTSWLGGQAAGICQLISLSKGDEALLESVAVAAGVNVTDLVRAAIQNRLTDWESATNKKAAVSTDMLMGKLSQR